MKQLMLLLAVGLILGLTSCEDTFVGVSDDFTADQIGERSGNFWTSLAPLPNPVEGASVACVGNNIYTAFGNDGFSDTRTMRIYDIDKDTWSFGSMAPMGYASSEGVGVAHDGKFYSVGGRSAAGGGAELLMYDPVLDTWTVLPSMTYGRQGLGAVVIGDYIYAIGGRNGGGPFAGGTFMAWVEKYDILNATWTLVAPLPSGRSDLGAAAIGGKIYIFGGYNGTNLLNAVMMYDPSTDSWTGGLAPLPTLRGAFYAVGTKGNTIYVIGGWDNIYPFGPTGSIVEAYKVSKDTWTTGLAPMITGRAETGAVSHGGRIYVIGGGQPGYGQPISPCEVYKP